MDTTLQERVDEVVRIPLLVVLFAVENIVRSSRINTIQGEIAGRTRLLRAAAISRTTSGIYQWTTPCTKYYFVWYTFRTQLLPNIYPRLDIRTSMLNCVI